ncbi:uncharacterized protein LOC141903657 [Tubulanus polymorphus]|uniref:uncharacterized protein LOC141903657 n=1 Tax=Tubulanus polymorphus TaxID=672921 RepID=UPI003DA5C1A7
MAMAYVNEDFSQSTEKNAADGFDELVERKKRETMYELRQLQLGEKPVTGRDSINKLDSFFGKRMEVVKQAEHANVPVNTDRVEEHRPESVVVEVTTLFENRPVTSVLQSTTFRRQLENIVRSSISEYHRAASAAPAPAPVRPAPAARSPPAVIPPPPLPPSHRAVEQIPEEDDISFESSSDSLGAVNNWFSGENSRTGSGIVISNDEWTRTVNILEDRREDLVADISELVRRQLVTSTLESPTRDRLESTVLSHLNSTGTDGRRVAEYINTIHSNDIIHRNDFSNLGIMPPVDNSDSLSMISATAHTVPYSQSNRALHQQMKSMKDQFEELKKMMQLSLDMQMDLQRSIRQEVAASLSAVNEPSSAAATTASRYQSYPANDNQCLICLENDADTVLYQCGHLCMCQGCAYALKERSAKCPVCRAPIKDMLRVYKCSINKS